MISKKGFRLPYKTERFYVDEEIKAQLFLMRVFGINQALSQKWIDKKRLYCEGSVVETKSQLIIGNIEVICYEPSSRGLKPIFKTDDFVVYDKPSKILVHPKNRSTLYSISDELKATFGNGANVVHRIDFETSGLVLCSLSKKNESDLKSLFKKGEIHKKYIAKVQGHIKKELIIDEPIAHCDNSTIKIKMCIDKSGKKSITKVIPIAYDSIDDATLVEVHPKSGRQHQIRLHLFHVKHSIFGDPIYGQSESVADRYLSNKLTDFQRIELTGADRLMLHASCLDFVYKDQRYIITSQNRLPI